MQAYTRTHAHTLHSAGVVSMTLLFFLIYCMYFLASHTSRMYYICAEATIASTNKLNWERNEKQKTEKNKMNCQTRTRKHLKFSFSWRNLFGQFEGVSLSLSLSVHTISLHADAHTHSLTQSPTYWQGKNSFTQMRVEKIVCMKMLTKENLL